MLPRAPGAKDSPKQVPVFFSTFGLHIAVVCKYMGSRQNYGPLLGPLNIRCRIIIGTRKGTIILTTTHMFQAQGKSRDCRGLPRLPVQPHLGKGMHEPWSQAPRSICGCARRRALRDRIAQGSKYQCNVKFLFLCMGLENLTEHSCFKYLDLLGQT